MGIGSQAVFCCTFSFTPNQITGSVWQQPRDWGSLLNFSESGRGRGGGGGEHSYYLLALGLDYMGFAMEATMEWKMGVGGTQSSPTTLGLGINAPPQISELCLGLRGGTAVFYPHE